MDSFANGARVGEVREFAGIGGEIVQLARPFLAGLDVFPAPGAHAEFLARDCQAAQLLSAVDAALKEDRVLRIERCVAQDRGREAPSLRARQRVPDTEQFEQGRR